MESRAIGSDSTHHFGRHEQHLSNRAHRTWLDRGAASCRSWSPSSSCGSGSAGSCPVLPLYFTEQGVDLSTLGFVIAAWPAARLVSEPIFGWLADRTGRVPLMVVGLIATGIFGALPLVLTGPLAFLVLRALAGLSAAIYDPAARGYLTDATPPGKRGEAFGLYGAAEMGGLLLGPAIAAFGAANFGGIGFRVRVQCRGGRAVRAGHRPAGP